MGKNPLRFQFFHRRTLRGRRWFWRLVAGNNKIIATSGEGFHNKADAVSATNTIMLKIIAAEVVTEEV